MNAILLTVLVLSGGGPGDSAGCVSEPCDVCCEDGHGHHGRHGCLGNWHDGHHNHYLLGPMPQSCYNPSFGCYASTRFMHRYPAFHGYYTRNAYNYRHYFDYPWHAGLHEPTSHFSYNVPGAPAGENIAPPMPTPAADVPRPIRSAQGIDTSGEPTPAKPRNLRR